MSPSTMITILVILIAVISFVLAFFLSGYLTTRAVNKIIRGLRERQATGPSTAVSPEDLGIRKRSLIPVRALKDQAPAALQLLIQHNIVQETENGKLYLVEEKLTASGGSGTGSSA